MDFLKKMESHLTLGKKMRDLQKEYFKLSRSDYATKNQVLAQAKAVEKKFDESTLELQELIKQGFKPELFR